MIRRLLLDSLGVSGRTIGPIDGRIWNIDQKNEFLDTFSQLKCNEE
jgi:hypothetical protein